MSTDNITVRNWCPDADMTQGLGDDGSVSGEKLVWKDVVAAGLNDGQGNTITMTEAIQLLVQLRASRG